MLARLINDASPANVAVRSFAADFGIGKRRIALPRRITTSAYRQEFENLRAHYIAARCECLPAPLHIPRRRFTSFLDGHTAD